MLWGLNIARTGWVLDLRSLETSRSNTCGQLRAECEIERWGFVIERLVTFVRVGVGKWSCDLDAL